MSATDLKTLAVKVRAMREAQRNYFKLRETYWLQESKRLEREVDGLVEAVLSERQA